MPALATRFFVKKFDAPDETKDFGPMRVDLISHEGKTYSRFTLKPGVRCTSLIPPEQLVDGLCNQAHLGYVISGDMRVEMKDGSKYNIKAGSVVDIPAGHDAIVTGNLDCSILDLTGEAPKL